MITQLYQSKIMKRKVLWRTQKLKNKRKVVFTIRELTIIGLLAGITIALGLSGYGIIPLGPLNVTTLHVPT